MFVKSVFRIPWRKARRSFPDIFYTAFSVTSSRHNSEQPSQLLWAIDSKLLRSSTSYRVVPHPPGSQSWFELSFSFYLFLDSLYRILQWKTGRRISTLDLEKGLYVHTYAFSRAHSVGLPKRFACTSRMSYRRRVLLAFLRLLGE